MQVEIDEGPPVPPPVRRRRRRRRVLVGLAAILVLAVPVALAVVGGLEPRDPDPADQQAAGGQDGDQDQSDRRGTHAEVVPPDLEGLAGVDEHFARLLLEVDAAERAMIGFQDELVAALGAPEPGQDLGELLARVRAVAGEGRDELLEVRDLLVEPSEDGRVEEVRAAYLLHLDAWAAYLEAVAEDPLVVLGQGGRTLHTLAINTTADAFARLLTARLPADVDPDVRRFADGILDRGFRGRAEATV